MFHRYFLIVAFVSSLFANSLQADCGCECPCTRNVWYGVIGTGTAISMKAGIDNPDPGFWEPTFEGYDHNLGYSPFFTLGLGRKCGCFDIDLTYTYYQTFHYQKHQTAIAPTAALPSLTRYFDLDSQNAMFNFTLDPGAYCSLSFCYVDIRPILGVGLGCGVNRVSNFHTVALNLGTTGATTDVGQDVYKAAFACQGTAGLRFHPCCSPLSFDLGYRYFYGGSFQGPSTIVEYTTTGGGREFAATPWEGRLQANEFFFSMNCCF